MSRLFLAVAAVPPTATGVDRVTTSLKGLPVALPLSDGVLLPDPVTFTDYQVLVDH